jgi:hypothetical protein
VKIDSIQLSEGSSFSNLSVDFSDTFPVQASKGEIFYKTGVDEGMYIYDGSMWYILANRKTISNVLQYVPVNVAGDTMKGTLVLSSDPVNPLDAATKQYVDAHSATALQTPRTISITGDATYSVSFDGTTNVASSITLATVNSSPLANSFQKVTVNGKGLVTATSAVSSTDITTSLGYTPVNKAGDTLTGTLTFTSGTVTGLPTPINPSDAANKSYVDGAVVTYTAGTGISISAGTISNTGVTNISGTTNQITASASNGSVTIGLPSAVTISGAMTAGSFTGAGTGLTGTASALSIGGNASTATNIASGAALQLLYQSAASTTAFVTTPSTTGTYLQYNGTTFSWVTPSAGTVTSVSATGTQGVTASVATSTTTPAITIGLGAITPASVAATGAVQGTQLISTIATGTAPLQVTSTTPVPNLSIGGSAATLTTTRSISATGDATWTVNFNGSANTTGALTLATVNAAPVTNSFQKVTTNGKGLVTATSAVTSTDITSSLGYMPVNKAGDTLTGTLTFTTGTVTGLPTPTNSSDATNKSYVDTASAYTAGTGISISSKTITNTGVTSLVAGTNIAVSGSTGAVTVSVTGTVPAANTANTLTTPRTISATGDATYSVSFDGSANVSAPLTLATVNASTGTFASVTVNGKGLVTSAANLAGDITTSGSTATLATVNTSPVTSSFQKVTVNGKGLVTATVAVMSSDIISSLGYTPISKTGDTVTGTLTFDGTHNVTGLPTPVNNTDAVNKSYVDSAISGVQAAATTPTNIGIVKMIAMNAFIL